MKNSNQYALITGGSSGIGYQYARELAVRNYNIIIVSNEDDKNKQACQQLINEFDIDALSFFIDLTLPDAAQKVFDFCIEKQLDVEILVNNAGMFFFQEITQTSLDKANKMLMLHVTTPTLLCALFSKYMGEKKSGHILITASITVWMSYPGLALYGATKRYLKNFARSLRHEMKDNNVNVSVVCPSAIDTDLYNLDKKYRKMALRTGIMISPEHLAKKAIRAMFHRRFLLIPTFLAKVSVGSAIITPPFVIQWMKRYMWKKLYGKD